MKHLPDEALVQKCLAGETEAFSVLVKRYEKQLFSLAYRMSGSYEDAADLAQDAFVQIYRMLDRFDTTKKFFPWMYRVAHNSCVNGLARRPQGGVPLDEYAEVIADDNVTANQPEAYYDNIELKRNIDAAIEKLPDNYRQTIQLRYLENLSYQQIADYLNLPLSTIETRLFRGRQLLQKSLAKYRNND